MKIAQNADPEICAAVESLLKGDPLPGSFSRIKSQVVVDDGLLCRSVKLPVDGEVVVPVIPATLEQQALRGVHETPGNCTWSSMHDLLRAECFFPGMAKACREYVDTCARCRAACPGGATSVRLTQAAVSVRPWNEMVLDILELGVDRTGRYHCVLVVVDMFTQWAEVMPLRQHTAHCVAEAFTTLCMRWRPPQVVRTGNGTKFQNAVVRSLFQSFGVVVKWGAVRHPQSQLSSERFKPHPAWVNPEGPGRLAHVEGRLGDVAAILPFPTARCYGQFPNGGYGWMEAGHRCAEGRCLRG